MKTVAGIIIAVVIGLLAVVLLNISGISSKFPGIELPIGWPQPIDECKPQFIPEVKKSGMPFVQTRSEVCRYDQTNMLAAVLNIATLTGVAGLLEYAFVAYMRRR